jgi:hypothetical protein
LVQTGKNGDVSEIHVFEEDFFAIKQRNMGNLVSSKSTGSFHHFFITLKLEVPNGKHLLTDHLPSLHFPFSHLVEIVLFFYLIVTLQKVEFLDAFTRSQKNAVVVEFVNCGDGR